MGPICGVDFPRAEGICKSPSDQGFRRVPLSDLDKNICFAPDGFQQLLDYISDLEAAAVR